MAAAVTAPPSVPRASPRRGRRAAGLSSLIRPPALAPGARLSSSLTRPRSWDVARRCSSRTEVAANVDDDEACELVSGADLVIGGDGDDDDDGESVRAYLLKAVKNNNGTGVLLLSDVFGFEDSATRDFAYRVACHGYNVLVPDLFRGSPWKKTEKDGFEAWLAGHAPERVSGDIDACTKWLVDEFTAAGVSKKLGMIGFCYGGGRLVETLVRDGGAGYSAGVCFYGSRMDASLAPRLAAPVLFVCGDGDPLCAVETVREMESRARGAKAVVYAGRGHAFAHRPQSLEDDGDAEDAFALMRGWLHDHLLA
ncbi:carboxymethylenebutenolidase homolog [Oryza brachyantha]|uniref:carboxymethylenebutenolidase homolog n=1 Tax=Oryza brachyantha TaxID=4533 RepID=UPI001ADA1E66|nr:carboxymethylenebutenolidase homolog [Oryza brachyantha]